MDSLRTFSACLWNDTDLPRLEAAASDNDKKLRAIQQLSGLPVFQAVQAATAEFAAVLPLLRSLRHEALRPRHWEELMQTTGSALAAEPVPFSTSPLGHCMPQKLLGDASFAILQALTST